MFWAYIFYSHTRKLTEKKGAESQVNMPQTALRKGIILSQVKNNSFLQVVGNQCKMQQISLSSKTDERKREKGERRKEKK